MTNHEALNEFERLTSLHGLLVPELAAHRYAGHTRQTWNALRRRNKVPVLTHLGVEYVSLEFFRKRDTRPGRTPFYDVRQGFS